MNNVLIITYVLRVVLLLNYLIFTDPSGVNRVCTIYSPNGINSTMMDIPSGTQNVILYCICMRPNVAVGPTTWFINGTTVTLTEDNGSGNPYRRDNVPSPLIIPLFTAIHAGTYGCEGFGSTRVTIDLAISGTYIAICVIVMV